jgi:hypothetical protein
MNLFEQAEFERLQQVTRRHFLKKCTTGLGAMALGSFLGCSSSDKAAEKVGNALANNITNPLLPRPAHFAPRAKRVIFLHMAGAPSQLELFDYKPELQKLHGQNCPQSLLDGKRFAFIKGVPQMLGPQAQFKQHGQSGAWVSEHLPHFSKVVDDVAFLKAMHTDEFNHAPAQLLMQTGMAGWAGLAWAPGLPMGLVQRTKTCRALSYWYLVVSSRTQAKVRTEADFCPLCIRE